MKFTRLAYKILGFVSLVLAAIGAVLPVMPTAIFVILAGWAFARGSPTLHAKLQADPRFGPLLTNWEAHGAISRPAKAAAVIGMVVSLTVMLILVKQPIVLSIAALSLCASAAFVLTRPSPPEPEPAPPDDN